MSQSEKIGCSFFKMAAKGEAVLTSIANRISQINQKNGAYRNATEDDCYRPIDEKKTNNKY